MWEQLKKQSFARTISSLYALCLLTLYLRVCLNIVGRYLYFDSVIQANNNNNNTNSGAGPSVHTPVPNDAPPSLSQGTQRAYLGQAEFFMNDGLPALVKHVSAAVERVFGPVPLKKKLTHTELCQLLAAVSALVENRPPPTSSSPPTPPLPSSTTTPSDPMVRPTPASNTPLLCQFLLPDERANNPYVPKPTPGEQGGCDMAHFQYLMDETRDILETPQFAAAMEALLARTFDVLFRGLEPYFQQNSDASEDKPQERETSSPDTPMSSLPLAKIVACINRQTPVVLSTSPNPYLAQLTISQELAQLCALVYSSFDSIMPETAGASLLAPPASPAPPA